MNGLRVHRPAIPQCQPTTNDPVDEPESNETERQPRDEQADPQGYDNKEQAERHPQQAEPERTDLPPEMRLQPGAARLAPLRVIQNHRDDGWPAGQECAYDGRGADDPREQAERVQSIDDLCPGNERARRQSSLICGWR